jgi:hypothetical protein
MDKGKQNGEVKLQKHGNYLYGVLDGVDFIQSGQLDNGTKYGASVKLKFITKTTVIKTVEGVEIPTQKAIAQMIKIPCANTELSMIVRKYNELIGRELLINYSTPDNNVFGVNANVEIVVVK